jgi:CzcA family heavy metal efflux pump
MLDKLIRWSLHNRALVIGLCAILLGLGWQAVHELPVEVLPDLTKPTVVVLSEAPGLAPEEVEALVTQPIESALQGVGKLTRLRSNSDVALSLVFAEFEWGTNIYQARQFVQERLQTVRLPKGTESGLTSVASLMGEILLVGLRCDKKPGEPGYVSPRDLRTLADWTVRRQLQGIPGIAEILSMGGGVRQLQVMPDPHRLQAYNVSLAELEKALGEAASNSTGGFIASGPQEIMVRNLAMTTDPVAIGKTVIKMVNDHPVSVADVAKVEWGVEPMRGDASIDSAPSVIMSITKSPGFDTLRLTTLIQQELDALKPSLPEGITPIVLFRQADFIENSIHNLTEAIRDGAIMVAIVIFLFLLNFRTTFITLMAMPLSFAVTLLIFKWAGISINSMTLGGLAVAIGMVVDDAIVDVENVYRRLGESGRPGASPLGRLEVIARASGEVRNSILYATVLIILVFLPLLGLEGLEGRLFGPIAIATIISMVASFIISLTAIPVLCSIFLRHKVAEHRDGIVTRSMKWLLRHTLLRLSLGQPLLLFAFVGSLVAAAAMLYPMMGKDFLPPFQEETALISMTTAPGTSLEQTNEVADAIEHELLSIPEVRMVGRRVGRAEHGDHVIPVSTAEFDIDFKKPKPGEKALRSRKEVLADMRARIKSWNIPQARMPGTFSVLTGPLADRIGHMLSGVPAPVAIKVFGPDLDKLREIAAEIQGIAKGIPGLEEAKLEQQSPIPQLRTAPDRDRALAYNVTAGSLNNQLATLVGGETVAELREGQRTVDLVLRLPPEWRNSPQALANLPIETASGRRIPLSLVADVYEAKGPNVINREKSEKRFIISIKPNAPDVGALVDRLEKEVQAKIKFPEGYRASYEGEFVAQRAASARIGQLTVLVLVVIAFLLYGYFRSPFFALQVLCDIPLAIVGGLLLTWKMSGNISIATLVGFIAVGGVAARNSIMLISHYLHLMRHEGEGFTRQMVERGTLERLVPVLMTALSAGIGLIPLVLASDAPGKEILNPVAVVICGGLVTSTLLGLGMTPAVFYLFGRRAAIKALENNAGAAH